ncbi:MAG TPA: M9 family metallopeptidase [Tahibacter sp.]|nr:M9 family metallopeptidase [Tahibacter sp.]
MYSINRLLQAGAGLALCLFGAASTVCAADDHFNQARPIPAPASTHEIARFEHVQHRALTWDERAPLPSSRDHLYRDYDRPQRADAARLACDDNAFAGVSGAALVAAVKGSTTTCVNALFSIDGALGAQVFPEAKMATIANAILADAPGYTGDNTGSMLQLVLFLRAGYYVQYGYPAQVGSYGATLRAAIRPALNAFVANGHFQDVNDAHGAVLSEFVTLIDSSGENAEQLGTVRGILDRYGPSYHASWNMKASVNNVFTVLFRGHYLPEFRTLVQGPGAGVLDTLVDFIARNKAADIGSNREYMLQNAAGELGRFLQYSGSFHTVAHPKVKAVLDSLTMGGPGGGIYVRIASVADYYDNAHCAYFNLCTFAQDLEGAILPAANARDCSATLRVRSQALTAAQLDTVCSIVGNEEGYFHTQAQTNNVPVADDNNTKLEMVIFHSSTDYETYSGVIFGNDTNNGGIYLEGDPSVVGNQARFLAYEAEWVRPTFEVWNLTHEYIHYLDGRFNWHGRFADYPMDAPASAIWYIEGFAEYISYSYRNLVNADAVDEAGNPDTFTLAQLFDTEYSTDYTRTYQWGYLATRFMFERHRDKIASLYALTRVGSYDPGYANWLNPIRTTYNAEFRAWLVCFSTNDGDTSSCGGPAGDKIFADNFGDTPAPPETPECTQTDVRQLDNGCKRSNLAIAVANQRLYLMILVPAGKTSLTFTMSGGTGDADLYYRGGAWPNDTTYDQAPQLAGNAETVTVSNPAQGWHYLMLRPKTASFEGVQVSAAWQ